MLAYLRLAVNHNDDEALKRIINYPARGIGDVTLEKLGNMQDNRGLACMQTLENLDSCQS